MRIKPINKFIKFVFGNILGDFVGITLCPFGIYLDKGQDEYVLNHEKIHWKQQLEMLIIPFYIWYIIELLIRRIKKSHYESYISLFFEREAFDNQNNLDYLKIRKPYAWVKLIFV